MWAKKAKQAQDEGKLDKKYDADGMIEKCRKALEQDPYNSGLALKKAGDYAEALRLFMLAAEAGSAEAASSVSGMYLKGEGVEKDDEESFRWNKKAAELGDPDSMFILAHAYSGGTNVVEKDLSKALFWAKKAEQARDGGVLFNFADSGLCVRLALDCQRDVVSLRGCGDGFPQITIGGGSTEGAILLVFVFPLEHGTFVLGIHRQIYVLLIVDTQEIVYGEKHKAVVRYALFICVRTYGEAEKLPRTPKVH